MEHKTKAYLLLGSNLGKREELLAKATQLLVEQAGDLVETSALYETAAWGIADQPDFLNQVLVLSTALAAYDLMACCQAIEKQLSPPKAERWGSRHLDIDILLLGDTVLEEERLSIPHRWLVQRRFALLPLAEVAPTLIHPVAKKTIADLLINCPDELEVRIFAPSIDTNDPTDRD